MNQKGRDGLNQKRQFYNKDQAEVDGFVFLNFSLKVELRHWINITLTEIPPDATQATIATVNVDQSTYFGTFDGVINKINICTRY